MARNQHCRIMSLFIGMFLMITIMSTYNVAASRINRYESIGDKDYRSLKRLRHLVRKLQRNYDDDLSFETRADPIEDCTGEIYDGYTFYGESYRGLMGIETVQRCIDSCDAHIKCVAWVYSPNNKNCWSFASVQGLAKDPDVKSGTCVGTNLKTKCTEKRDGAYNGPVDQTLKDIATVEDCMAQCDQSARCFGWVYGEAKKICILSPAVGPFEEINGLTTGSCIAPQNRFRPDYSLEDFRQQALRRHNRKRKEHCTPELALDANLNQVSQDLADQMAAADVTPPVYQADKTSTVYYNKADAAIGGAYTVDCFYDEYKHYKFEEPDLTVTSDFAKVLWKSSTMMGAGRAFASDNGTMYIVTTYDWQGDMSTSLKDNVLPKCV